MRPPKRILLIDPEEDRRSELKFVLQVCGYRVIQDGRNGADLVIAYWPIAAGSLKRLQEQCDCPILVLAPVADRLPTPPHAAAVHFSNASRAELLRSIRVLSARKRGPRKGVARKPHSTANPEPAATAAIA